MSNSRKQIEAWLKTIDVKGSVIDVGGLFMPVKGRTKTWEVERYEILDIKKSRHGIVADHVYDLNRHSFSYWEGQFDNAFCIEVIDHFWNPVVAFQNMNLLLKTGGYLYTSSNFLFPHHTGFDCARFTDTGLKKLLSETGFKVLHQEPRFAVDIDTLGKAMRSESKVYYNPGVIGWMMTAQKL